MTSANLCQALRHRVDSRYTPKDWPTGLKLCEELSESRPLTGLTVLDATPVFWNTFTQYLSLLNAGANLLIGVSDVMPADPQALEFLRHEGARIVTPDTAPRCDIVCDCAGAFRQIEPRIGYVELTRSGVDKYTDCKLPVFLADGGRIKLIETTLGTGESLFRALDYIGRSPAPNDRIVVFGSGKVGSGIVLQALRRGLTVSVVTNLDRIHPTLERFAFERIDRHDSIRVLTAISEANYVVTATGFAGAVQAAVDPLRASAFPAIFANMGVEDEFGPGFAAERVLAAKRPLNFLLDEPTHLRYIDATMSLVTLGAAWLTTHRNSHGITLPDSSMEDRLISISLTHGSIAEELKDLYG